MVIGARMKGSRTSRITNVDQVRDLRALVSLPPNLPEMNAVPTETAAPIKDPKAPGRDMILPLASAAAYAHARRRAFARAMLYRMCSAFNLNFITSPLDQLDHDRFSFLPGRLGP